MLEPAIKWSGSKRTQAEAIIQHFPKEISTYYEPFCGGASVLHQLMLSDISVKHFVCSDVNADLISLWNYIKKEPRDLILYYTKLWDELNVDDDKERKKRYFESVRARYNKERDPKDFLFIMRTTTNGMPRYNKQGLFNNSFHITRNGIRPESLKHVLQEWSYFLNLYKVQFICCDFKEITPTKQDYVYLDPPYANTKGMYYGTIDYVALWEYLRKLPCKYALSFDGVSGNVDNTYAVPTDLYTQHLYLWSGNSSFKRTIGKSNDSIVYESLYIK